MDATVIRGRCPPYGEGITYWPVVEVLKQLDVRPAETAAVEAIRSLLGETEVATSAEEIAWAFRKTLEQVAAERPLVVVFDDIQWGEETFLELIEHIVLLSTGASILLLCMARPELTDRRPAWPVAIRLEPLGDDDVDQLLPQRIGGDLREKLAHAAGGNPLFIEEMLAIAGEAGVTWSSHQPCGHCSRRDWIGSSRPSGACSSGVRSRGRSSTAVPYRRSHPGRPR